MWSRLVLLTPALLLVACGSETSDAPDAAPSPSRSPSESLNALKTPGAVVPASPPPVMLITADGDLEAAQGSYCWQSGDAGMCVDKDQVPTDELPDVGEQAVVEFRFSMPGAKFTASLDEIGGPGQASAVAVDQGDGTFRLEPDDVAPGRYRVWLDGQTSGGEAPGEFVWTIPAG